MKKITLLFTLFLLIKVSAQEKFKYGVTGNFHQGSITGVHDRSEGKFGGSLGFFTEWSLVENDVFDSAWLYITPQIEYNMGGENADANKNVFSKQRFSHDYVAMEVYLKYFFHKGNMKRDFFAFAGPKIEYLVRQKREVPDGYDAVYYKFNLDNKINKFGYGVSAGIGLKINQRMETYLRYDQGFSKVYENNDINNTHNRFLALGLNFYLHENWW